ncbi:MAG: response regulator transcription factor [Desulfovibrionaceae bacterium]|nr:response regulator transcription factor [Desulfovibrionaceae bacterium]
MEDELKIAQTVMTYLRREGYTVFYAATIAESLKLISSDIDLIVLDLMLPDGQGEDLCAHVVGLYNTPVIMLTSKRSEQSKINGFASGADDYLAKPFSPRELVARVKAVLKRSRPVENVIHIGKNITMYVDKHTVCKNGTEIKLTPNEYKVLHCLVSNSKAVVSRDKLLEYIDSPDASDRIVDVHIAHLRQKPEDDPKKPEIIKTVYSQGYSLGVELHA